MRTAETEAYWKEVPGDKLYVFADKIVDLNLSYESHSRQTKCWKSS